jgi:hypothetical protein
MADSGGADALPEAGSDSGGGSIDSSQPPDSGALSGDDGSNAQDSSLPPSDADTDSTSPADSVPPADSTVADTGSPIDTGMPDTATSEGATCPASAAGPSPSYLTTCTGCNIDFSTCVLSCTSCTRRDQSQNPNPLVLLPCPANMSVENNDGSLICN